jgi:ADP-dependent NAD(P)H-hydrate dehydratase / NAD(P)H-hydrate epimerase
MRSSWPLVSAAQMRALDEHTIRKLGVPGDVLMESAGRAVVQVVLALLAPGDSVCVVCGPGNNGGDGLVIARHLHQLGVPVRAALLSERLGGDAAPQLVRARAVGVPLDGKRWRAPASGVIVDALFGTGLARTLAGDASASVKRINAARSARPGAVRVVAVDLPSGLSSDTGQVLGAAVAADVTVTIGLPKLGLVFEPGRGLAGRITVARIGIADAVPNLRLDTSIWTRAGAAAALPVRPNDAHKGTFGHALLVAGSEGKTGAAALCAEGAGRVGAGLVTLACPAGLNDILEAKITEAMTAPLPDTGARQLAAAAEDGIVALAATRDAVGLGPGIGRARETTGLVRALAKRLDLPLAIDADGVVAFAGELELLRSRRAPTVLTPHPGEAAAVLGVKPAQINADRARAARELAAKSGAVVLLKGAGTAIAAPDGELIVNPTGGPALATGGTGDVLLGVVTGLLAQGVPPLRAAALAAYLHGAAGDRISARRGDTGLLAHELLLALPLVIMALREAPPPDAFERELAAAFPQP